MSARVRFRPTNSDCFSGLCHKGCSHRMWACDECGFEGGWGAPVDRLQEWADAHECPPVSTHEERAMTDLDFEARCPECGTDVSRGAPCLICRDGSRCCPCYHEEAPND